MPSEWPYTGDPCILIERNSIGAVDHDVWTLSGADGSYVCEAQRRWAGTISTGHMTDQLSATYAEPYRICVVDNHGQPAELPATKWTISDGETSNVVEFADEGEQMIPGTGSVRVYTTESPITVGDWQVYSETEHKVPCTPPCAYGLAHYCDPDDVPATVRDLEGKQNVLTAGENVSIEEDIISVPIDIGDGLVLDSSDDVPYLYVALADENPGLEFDDGALKVDWLSVQPVLTAGENITIADNVISASGGSPSKVSIDAGVDAGYEYSSSGPAKVYSSHESAFGSLGGFRKYSLVSVDASAATGVLTATITSGCYDPAGELLQYLVDEPDNPLADPVILAYDDGVDFEMPKISFAGDAPAGRTAVINGMLCVLVYEPQYCAGTSQNELCYIAVMIPVNAGRTTNGEDAEYYLGEQECGKAYALYLVPESSPLQVSDLNPIAIQAGGVTFFRGSVSESIPDPTKP